MQQQPKRNYQNAVGKNKDISHLANIEVLIIDEDTLIPSITRNILESFGFKKIFHAKNPDVAAEILDSNAIDLVISEWPMSPRPGIDIVKFIRMQNKVYRRIPIILVTGKGDIQTVRKARDSGMTEFLVKPFRVNMLCDRIISVVEAPREFILSNRYTGPDRRRRELNVKDDRRGQIPEEEKKIRRKGNLKIVEYKGNTVVVADADYSMKQKIGDDVSLRDIFTEEAIEAAEAVVEESSDSFMEDVSELLMWLEKHYKVIQENPEKTGRLAQMMELSLSVKSKSGVFGYDLATRIAKFLHDYLEGAETVNEDRLTVIREHIDTLKVIFHQRIKGEGGDVGKTLLDYMQKLTIRYPAK